MDILLQQIINGLVLGSMYALIALGYTMVYGIIQLINFAHGEVLMVGALTSWSCIGLMQDATRPVPMHLRNAPTQLMKALDYGKGYRYAHDEEGGFAAGENYLPEGMAEPGFYQPVERGLEIKIAQKMRDLRERNVAAAHPDVQAPDTGV